MDQLSGADARMLNQERPHAPNHFTSVNIYDPSTAPGGAVSFEELTLHVESRLDAAPGFRRRLVEVPFGLDRPYWLEDPNFDLEFHLRQMALPRPGDWQQFCSQVARIGARRLDPSRPLWELYMIEQLDDIPGVPEGAFATILKVHNAVVDVEDGIEMLSVLHDTGQGSDDDEGDEWIPDLPPSNFELLANAAVHALARPFEAARLLAREGVPLLRRAPGELLRGITRPDVPGVVVHSTRFNKNVSPHRVFDACRFPLAEVKAVRSAVPGSTVNDVALAIVGGAMRSYLMTKAELPPYTLAAAVPLSVGASARGARDQDRGDGGSERFAMLQIPIGTHLGDPLERLRLISRAAQESDRIDGALDGRALVEISDLLPGALVGFASRNLAGVLQRAGFTLGSQTVLLNVPGSSRPLSFAGARLVSSTGMTPLVDGSGLMHLASSYCDEFSIAVTSTREMLPDPEHYASCLQHSFDDLVKAAAG